MSFYLSKSHVPLWYIDTVCINSCGFNQVSEVLKGSLHVLHTNDSWTHWFCVLIETMLAIILSVDAVSIYPY